MSIGLNNIDTHDVLVRRARKCINRFAEKIIGPDNHPNWYEQNDIIAGAFETAARQLTTSKGAFLNSRFRMGSSHAFHEESANLSEQMGERLRNWQQGWGTSVILHRMEEANRERARVRKEAAKKAAEAAAKATAKRRRRQKKEQVAKSTNQTTRRRTW